jgi:hypothetical protein
MKRGPALFLLLLTGCSTAPIADVMDFFTPGSLPTEKTTPYGGVCLPQGITAPPATTTAPAPQPIPATAVAPLEWPPRNPAPVLPGPSNPPPPGPLSATPLPPPG